jgi:hypothetical protein
VVRDARRRQEPTPLAPARLRSAHAAVVRRRPPHQRTGVDRALPLCPGQRHRRVGRRAAAPGRRDRLRLHAHHALQPDRRLQDHPQRHHHVGERYGGRLHGVGGLQARGFAMPAGRGRRAGAIIGC